MVASERGLRWRRRRRKRTATFVWDVDVGPTRNAGKKGGGPDHPPNKSFPSILVASCHHSLPFPNFFFIKVIVNFNDKCQLLLFFSSRVCGSICEG
jgi:hypothetical protein